MNAADLLRRYVELARWETHVAEPKGILTDLERYPEPYQQDARLFEPRFEAGDVADLAAGGSVIEDDSLGFLIQAIETPEAVFIVDDTTGDGFFRIAKNKPEDCPRTNAAPARMSQHLEARRRFTGHPGDGAGVPSFARLGCETLRIVAE